MTGSGAPLCYTSYNTDQSQEVGVDENIQTIKQPDRRVVSRLLATDKVDVSASSRTNKVTLVITYNMLLATQIDLG